MKLFVKISFVFCLMINLFSCKKEDISKGPDLKVASSDFKLENQLAISDSTVDFKNDSIVLFTSSFSEEVNYTINITGLESGATFSLSGSGKEVSKAWNGRAKSIFFKKERCLAELTVLGKEEVLSSILFKIEQTPNDRGELISNFEPLGRNVLVGFWEDPVNGQPTRLFTDRTNQFAVEGEFGYIIKGINRSFNPTRFLGLVFSKPIFGTSGVDNSGVKFIVPTTNAKELYFNIWIYGEGKDQSFLAVKFLQDDNLNGEHDEQSDNGFEYFIRDVSHHGWKLFSVRYDQLVTSGNTDFGGAGDGVHRPETISQIEFALWSKVSNKPVSIIMDYPIFTKNSPLN